MAGMYDGMYAGQIAAGYGAMSEADRRKEMERLQYQAMAAGYAQASQDYAQGQQAEFGPQATNQIRNNFDLAMEGTKEASKLQTFRNNDNSRIKQEEAMLEHGLRKDEAMLANALGNREQRWENAAKGGIDFAKEQQDAYGRRLFDLNMRGVM